MILSCLGVLVSDGQTDRQTDERTDIGGCRVAFATENAPVAFLSIFPIKLHLFGSPRTVLESSEPADFKTILGDPRR